MSVTEIITSIKEEMDRRGGLKAVYFVACGGSLAAIYPGRYCLQSETKKLSVASYSSNEFVYATPAALDKNCLVVCCSLKATPETVEAVKVANKAGAVTIAMTGNTETGMAKVGQHVVVYSNGDSQVYSDSNQSNALRIAFEILHKFEEWPHYAAAMDGFGKIDAMFANAKTRLAPRAKEFGQAFKDDEVFYVLASGPLYGTAYTMSSCHFMEMQWRHAVTVHSGEYFHGTFETTSEDTAMVLLKSTGRTRFLDERVQRFLALRNKHHIIIDAAEIGMDELDPNVAEFFNSIVMIPLERYFVSEMAEVRGHSMDDRRYMWKGEY